MVDSSGTKLPENRIHLYDPVGLINDGYGNYRPSVKPRRQTVSYDNFSDTTSNNNSNNLSLRSYDSFTDANNSGGLRSYDTFEVDSFSLRSFNESFSSDTNGVTRSSQDTTTTTTELRNDGGLKFNVVDPAVEDDQSDVSTPRLWRPSSPTSPKALPSPLHHNHISPKSVNYSSSSASASSHLYHSSNTNTKSVNFPPLNNPSNSNLNSNHHNYQTMSPSSRTQAIAKGRRELMEMVRDLPETFYELSLKDIVEQKAPVDMEVKKEIDIPEEMKPMKEMNTTKMGKEAKQSKKQRKSSKKVKKSESKKKMVRSKSVDNGKFLLKTSVFPILGSRKSKKNLTAANSFKVAPMPKGEQTSNGHLKIGEKEWWRRKSCISSESDDSNGLSSQSTSSHSSSSSSSSSSCSSRSNSSIGRRSNRFLPNCCLFNGRRIEGKK